MLSINVHRCVGLLKCLDVHRAGEVSADDGLFVVVRELEAQEACGSEKSRLTTLLPMMRK